MILTLKISGTAQLEDLARAADCALYQHQLREKAVHPVDAVDTPDGEGGDTLLERLALAELEAQLDVRGLLAGASQLDWPTARARLVQPAPEERAGRPATPAGRKPGKGSR